MNESRVERLERALIVVRRRVAAGLDSLITQDVIDTALAFRPASNDITTGVEVVSATHARNLQREISRITAYAVAATELLRRARDWTPWHEPTHPDYQGEFSDVGRAIRDFLANKVTEKPENRQINGDLLRELEECRAALTRTIAREVRSDAYAEGLERTLAVVRLRVANDMGSLITQDLIDTALATKPDATAAVPAGAIITEAEVAEAQADASRLCKGLGIQERHEIGDKMAEAFEASLKESGTCVSDLDAESLCGHQRGKEAGGWAVPGPWVSVDEAMPTLEGRYLIVYRTTKGRTRSAAFIADVYEGRFSVPVNDTEITHWMAIPELPEAHRICDKKEA